MLKISYRDSYSAIPKILLDRFKEQKSNVINVTGYENYTDEVLKKLREMFDAGEIESFPVKWQINNVQFGVYWIKTNDQSVIDGVARNATLSIRYIHRNPSSLPALEWIKKDSNGKIYARGQQYFEDGKMIKQEQQEEK